MTSADRAGHGSLMPLHLTVFSIWHPVWYFGGLHCGNGLVATLGASFQFWATAEVSVPGIPSPLSYNE